MRHPPYTHWLERVPFHERQQWYSEWLVDQDGHPANELARQLLTTFFGNPKTCFGLETLAEDLFLDPRHMLVLCRQLTVLNLIEEVPVNSLRFRLTERPWNLHLFQAVRDGLREMSKAGETSLSEHRRAA